MTYAIQGLFDTSGFPPRWQCGQWSDQLGWLHILSDLAIFGAYFAIPLSLLYFIGRRGDVPLRGIFWLFAGFILFCGTTHLIEAIIFWEPIYRLAGWVKLATAIISWTTVIALIRLMPTAVTLPSVRAANMKLMQEIEQRESLETELTQARNQLEQRSATLTQRDHRIHAAMVAADACAVRWDVETNDILWHVGGENILKMLNRNRRPFENWRDMLPDEIAEQLRQEARLIHEPEKIAFEREYDSPSQRGVQIRVVGCPDGGGKNGPAMLGMFRMMIPNNTC